MLIACLFVLFRFNLMELCLKHSWRSVISSYIFVSCVVFMLLCVHEVWCLLGFAKCEIDIDANELILGNSFCMDCTQN